MGVWIGQPGQLFSQHGFVRFGVLIFCVWKTILEKCCFMCFLRYWALSQVVTSPPGMGCYLMPTDLIVMGAFRHWICLGELEFVFRILNILAWQIYVHIIYCFGNRQWPGPNQSVVDMYKANSRECENNKCIVGRQMHKLIQSLKIYVHRLRGRLPEKITSSKYVYN